MPTLTDALILRTWPYSESSLIVSLLTSDRGVVRALAKGGRRLKGRTAAALDLFTLVRAGLRVRSGEGLSNLGAVEVRREWLYLRADLSRLALASVGIEVLGAVASTSPSERFFLDEATTFLTLMESASAPGSLTGLLLIRLAHHAGDPPRLDPALGDRPLPRRVAYDFNDGAVIDAESPADPRSRRMELPRAMVERIRPALQAHPELADAPIVDARHGATYLQWLARYWEDRLGAPLRAMEFLRGGAGVPAGK
jgi:recombinational DNA repair protein (RecF pathway)